MVIPQIFMSVIDSSIAEPWLNTLRLDELCVSVIIELYVHFVLHNESAFIHL